MNDHIYEIQSYVHKHDRYGYHSLLAKPRSMCDTPLLMPTTQPIDPSYRIFFPSIVANDTVHCQGGGDHIRSIVFKEPSESDRIRCSCGYEYVATPMRVRCPNPSCSRTEFGRVCFLIASVFQKTMTKHALSRVYTDLAFHNIDSINSLLSKSSTGRTEGVVDSLVRSVHLLVSQFRDRRNIYDADQNSFVLSLIDSFGLPHLRISDIYNIFGNESIDYQNGDGGDSAEYYYNVLSQPEYLQQVTGMPLACAMEISHVVEVRNLSSTFSMLGKFSFSSPWQNDNDLFS